MSYTPNCRCRRTRRPDLYRGTLTLADGKTPEVNLLVLLKVLPVSLPARPRFTVEWQAPPILARQYLGAELASRAQGVASRAGITSSPAITAACCPCGLT